MLKIFSLSSFNSIKVRLRQDFIKITKYFHTRFQFHKGTIKTLCSSLYRRWQFEFQFHKGTIKTPAAVDVVVFLASFNSIKVRLRQNERMEKCRRSHMFQFHKGTIKTVGAGKDYNIPQVSIP